MRKLLKFAAPILILALIFASCDDRGSTPSGGGSGQTLTISLQEREDYPSSGFQVVLTKDGETASESLALAKSVSYTPASNGEKAFLTVTGIPSGAFSESVMVLYASIYDELMIGEGNLELSLGDEISGSVDEFTNQTPQSIVMKVSAPEGSEVVLPLEKSAYRLTITDSSEEETYVLEAEDVEAAPSPAEASATNYVNVTYVAQQSPIEGLVLPISGSDFSGAISFAVDGNDYEGSVSSLALTPGSSEEAKPEMEISQILYGDIKVTLPASLYEKGPAPNAQGVSVSYSLYNAASAEGAPARANVPVSSLTPEGDEEVTGYSFSVQRVAASETTGSDVTIVVTASYEGVDYIGTTEGAKSPSYTGSEVKDSETTISKFAQNLAALTVAIEDGPSSWVESAKAYAVSYTQVANAEGDEIENPDRGSLEITSEVIQAIQSGELSIAGRIVGAFYKVTVTVKTGTAVYEGSGITATATVQGDSGNDITVTLGIISGTAEDEPEQVTGTVTIPAAQIGSTLSDAKSDAESATVKWGKSNGTYTDGTGTWTTPASGDITLSDVPTNITQIYVQVVVTGGSNAGTYTSTNAITLDWKGTTSCSVESSVAFTKAGA